jgi:ATP-dependent helicase HrpB
VDVLKKLPVFQEFEKFKQQWATNSHVILKSPTGSGKSIALPYLLATTGLVKGKILVVQPRRIAARLLATQVARIAQWSLGKEVGSQFLQFFFSFRNMRCGYRFKKFYLFKK